MGPCGGMAAARPDRRVWWPMCVPARHGPRGCDSGSTQGRGAHRLLATPGLSPSKAPGLPSVIYAASSSLGQNRAGAGRRRRAGQPRSLPARGFRGVYQEVKSVRTVLALLLGVALGAVVFAAAWPAAPAESAANAPPQGPAQGKIGHGLSRADCHAGRPKPSRSQAADCRSGRNALGAGRPRRRAAGEIRVH